MANVAWLKDYVLDTFGKSQASSSSLASRSSQKDHMQAFVVAVQEWHGPAHRCITLFFVPYSVSLHFCKAHKIY